MAPDVPLIKSNTSKIKTTIIFASRMKSIMVNEALLGAAVKESS